MKPDDEGISQEKVAEALAALQPSDKSSNFLQFVFGNLVCRNLPSGTFFALNV